MKTKRLDNGLLVFDGGPMDGVLVHESSHTYKEGKSWKEQ